MRVAQLALGVGLTVWMAGLMVAPAALFPVGRFICHQRADRSFFVRGRQMPVCARCTGLYAGGTLAVPMALAAASAMASRRARRIALVAALPTAVTWSLEFAGLMPFSNAIRFAAALPLGFVAVWLVMSVLAEN